MTPVRHVVYLHGFASSPASGKARRFRDELERRRIGFSCPDLNEPAFETLTVSRMVAAARDAITATGGGPVALVGSSLGGLVALHAASADDTGWVDRLVLLAPALEFGGNRLRQFGDEGIEQWRTDGRLRVFHYGAGEFRDVGFGLYEDAARYDVRALAVRWPTLVVQGRADETVDPGGVEAWCASRPAITLRLLNDTHQLIDSLDRIWTDSEALFGLGGLGSVDSPD